MAAGDPDRLRFLLEMVEREGRHLLGTDGRLFAGATIDSGWVEALENDPELAERVDAFAARFARMQDTIGDRLIPELRRRLLEEPGSALDNLNQMEKLGLLNSVTDWIEARNLRNRLVHEYLRDASEFAGALNRAHQLVILIVETGDAINRYAKQRFAAAGDTWPNTLQPP
jgi:hypothetical protein